jgi:hypothetical protein
VELAAERRRSTKVVSGRNSVVGYASLTPAQLCGPLSCWAFHGFYEKKRTIGKTS